MRAIHVRAGDPVTVGQVLVELEANETRAVVGRTRAELARAANVRAAAASSLEAARAAAQLARTNRDRDTQLLASGAIPRAAFDDSAARTSEAEARLAAAEAQLHGADAAIDAARAAVAEGEATLAYARVTAPFSGRVVERFVDPGALASPGSPLFVLDDAAQLRVEAAVPESHAAALRIGAPVEVELAAVRVTGTIAEIVPQVDLASRALLVKVDLPATAGALQPGAFARIAFVRGTTKRLVVPTEAISTFGALDRVFVAEHGAARLRMITRGEAQGPWTEVLTGLQPDERVVVTPAGLRDGARIEVRP